MGEGLLGRKRNWQRCLNSLSSTQRDISKGRENRGRGGCIGGGEGGGEGERREGTRGFSSEEGLQPSSLDVWEEKE